MTPSAASPAGAVPHEPILDSQQTSCCVVGAGPGGAILALLLARKGVPVTLLEAHKDFDRDFRGDTVHPSTLELLDEIGLADRLLELRHTKVYGPTIRAANGPFMPVDLRNFKTKFPYIMLVPQTNFLEFIVAEAKKFPSFRLIMNGNVQSLIEVNGTVNGVRFLGLDGWHEVRATLTVGADGRFSRIRHLMGIQPVATSPPMDVLWFRLPRMPDDPREPAGVFGGFGRGHILVVLDRFDYWQVGYVFPKGDYQHLRAAGLEELRRSIAAIEPQFTKHVEYLTDWQQCSLLSVESSFCKRWYKPGVLLIGDAAHVMSPVGGVEDRIANYQPGEQAAQDAVELSGPWFADAQFAAVAAHPASGEPSTLRLAYSAAEINLVMAPGTNPFPSRIHITDNITDDGAALDHQSRGADVREESDGSTWIEIDRTRMYSLVKRDRYVSRTLALSSRSTGLQLFAFTFASCVPQP